MIVKPLSALRGGVAYPRGEDRIRRGAHRVRELDHVEDAQKLSSSVSLQVLLLSFLRAKKVGPKTSKSSAK